MLGIYVEYKPLFDILKQQINSIFNLFNQIDKPIRDLEHESSSYLWYQLFRDTLMTMHTETDQCKQQLINYCRSYYRLNKKYLEDINTFEQTYKSSDAIRWYTKDSFLYRFVNKALRTEDIEALFRLRFFIKDLCKNLKLLFDENFEAYQESLDEMIVYRGLTLPIDVIDRLTQSVGKYVSTNGFLSTSLKCDVAEMFSANVIFEIRIQTDLKNIIYGYIAKMSINPSEDEVLFDLGAIFQIKDVLYKNNKYFISMIGIDNNIECLKSDYFQTEREYLQDNLIGNILSNINAYSFFGKFLLTIGSNKKAIDYFEDLYKNNLSNYENKQLSEYETYIISGNLADAYAQNGQYDLALKYALESYQINKNFVYDYSISIAVSLLRLSLIYFTKDDIELALKSIEEAMQSLPENPKAELLRPIYLCLAKCYLKKNYYPEALTNCQISLEKFMETKNYIALSETYFVLGKIYRSQSDYETSIKHFEQSLLLQKNIYSKSHSMHIRTCYNLAEIYYLTAQYDLCIQYYSEILDHENEDIDILYDHLAVCYLKLGQYDLAYKYAKQSLDISEKASNIEGIELSYVLIGDILIEQKDYKMAAECYEKLVKKSIEYNNFEIMKNARSQYVSIMTRLIIQQADENFEDTVNVLSEFYQNYLYNEKFFIFEDLRTIIFSIIVLYSRVKNFSFGIKQFRRMANDIENLPNNDTKYRILFFLNAQIGRFYERNEDYQLAINQYKSILSRIKSLDDHHLTDHIIDTALQCYDTIGELYYQLDEYNLAIESQLEGLQFIEKSNTNECQQELFDFNYLIGNCYSNLENYDLALVYYIKCNEIEQKTKINIKESEDSIFMYKLTGNFYFKDKQYDLAIDCYKKGLNMLETDEDDDYLFDTIYFNHKLGCCYKIQNKTELFTEHFQTALKVYEENKELDYDKVKIMDMNFQLGWLYQKNQSYDLALEYFEKMLSIQLSLDINDKSYIADSYVCIGKCYQQKLMDDLSLNFYEKALELYRQSLEIDTMIERRIADVHWRIGKIFKSQHDWNSSIEHYENSLKFIPNLDTKVIFDLYSDLGFCYQQISNNEILAIDYYKKAIDINPYDDAKITEFYYQIGICYQNLEEFSDAIQYLKNAQKLLNDTEEKDFVKLYDIYTRIGFCFCKQNDWNSSIDYCLMAFEIHESIEIHNISVTYRLFTTIAHDFGQKEMYKEAVEYFEKALKIQEDEDHNPNDKRYEIIHLNNQIGYCYFMLDQLDTAYNYFYKSIDTAKNSSFYTQHFSMIDNYEMLGYIYMYYDEKILAKHCFNKVIKLLESSNSINLVTLKRIRKTLKILRYDNSYHFFE